MRRRTTRLAVLTIAAACALPCAAASADSARYHGKADDAAPKSAAQERRMTRRTLTATASDARQARVAGDPGVVGSWSAPVDWPVVGVHVAVMPDGRVLAYDSVGDKAPESYTVHDRTRATLWNPQSGLHTDVSLATGFNLFCSGLGHMPSGALLLAGGNKDAATGGIRQTHYFGGSPARFTRGPDMAHERWYPTVTGLGNGEMLITEGRTELPEVLQADGRLRELTTAPQGFPLYPWIDVAPDGRAFYSGPGTIMHSLDARGTGAWKRVGWRDDIYRTYGGRALYDVGKLLVAGGGPSTRDSRVLDLNQATPSASPTAPMATGRRQHNLTLLADGTALATGGNSSGAEHVDLANGVYTAEQWSPATGRWTTLAAQRMTRQYHSSAVLLPDGRVLSSGGGVCATCDDVGYLAKNAEIFSPPYLFKKDGSGALATRPTITAAPSTIAHGAAVSVSTAQALAIRKVGLIRLGAATHSTDMDQRYVPLAFTASGRSGLQVTGPASPNVAPPGPYMLVIVDAAGVPSVARMVTVPRRNAPPTATVLRPVAGAAFTAPASVAIEASADDPDGSVAKVEFFQGTTKVGEDASAPYTHTWSGVGAGTYAITARATDAAGATGTSPSVTATVRAPAPPPDPAPVDPALVGAWGFEEPGGAQVLDASGRGNAGELSGATRTGAGRSGAALAFDGVDDWVTVPDAPSLALRTQATLEAWVAPTAGGGWRTALMKERPGTLAYGLYTSDYAGVPSADLSTTAGDVALQGPAALPPGTWTHLAMTWDGTTQRLFVNGTESASRPLTGFLNGGPGPLRLGGNGVWGEWFAGRLDDVRVYSRALGAAEVQRDMGTAVGG